MFYSHCYKSYTCRCYQYQQMGGIIFKCLKRIWPNSLLAFKNLCFVHDTGCALMHWSVRATLEMHVIMLDQECETGAI